MKNILNISKPLAWFSALLLTAFMAGCGNGGSHTILGGPSVATIGAPSVTSTVPANGDSGVQINRRITATFSVPTMDAATITTASFKVTGPLAAAVAGTVTYAGSTAVFTPTTALAASTLYTATVTTLVKNQIGTAMAANHVWSFNTGLTADTTAPKIISTGAANGATGLAVNRVDTATFSEAMDPTTLASPATSYTVKEFVSGNNVPGTVTYLGNTATFQPTINLQPNMKYTSTITTAATDLSANPLAAGLVPNPWSWTTGPIADIIPPTITNTNPAALATLVPVGNTINATFSEAMNQATMVTANFTVKETVSGNAVAGTVAYDVQNNIATFTPLTSLTLDTDYTVTVSNGAKDIAGNALVVPAVGGLPKPNPWTFRTAAAVVTVPLAINLRGAASFGIASRAGMTSSGVTVVNGDVALYPNPSCTDSTGAGGASQGCAVKTYSSPTGMTVNGSIYFFNDPFDNGGTANSVTNDLNIAWIEGKNKVDTFATSSLSGQLAGKTLVPGVYHETVLNLAAGGTCQIDAVNDANAIFIIKVDTDFTDSGILINPSQITLIRGAQAKNVWFVIGGAATIGTGTTWNGNILAGGTLSISGGSTVTGRLLAGAAGAGAFTMTTTPPETPITINVP